VDERVVGESQRVAAVEHVQKGLLRTEIQFAVAGGDSKTQTNGKHG
jgi:hypothetical protein